MKAEQIMFDGFTPAPARSEKQKQRERFNAALQKWSDRASQTEGEYNGKGVCGNMNMCDYCEDNSYGRPCARAFNAMIRENKINFDYSDTDFDKLFSEGKL